MSLQALDTNVAPFFDDFDETKNYHRIMFRPRSVQARELTQLQTILQSQIDRMGRHFFEEGAAVIPGGINTKTDQDTIKALINGAVDKSIFTNFDGKIYAKSMTRTLEAKVILYQEAAGTTPAAFAIEYVKSDEDGGPNKFQDGEPCLLTIRDESGDTDVVSFTATSTHKGLFVSVIGGIYFVRGMFVIAHNQSILADAFDNTADVRVGFLIGEEIIDETKDESLNSNAIGYPNFKAPGAARLKMSLNLAKLKDGERNSNFVEIVRFQGGELQSKVENTNYSLIEKAIAQRTYETHGDYVVRDYPISAYQHLRDEVRPDGLYIASRGGDESKFVIRLGQGIGYSRGYRSEITGFQDIIVEKARDTAIVNNAAMVPSFGSYIIVDNTKSIPPIDIKQSLELLAADGVTKVGECRVRAIKREGASSLRLYIFDINMLPTKTFAEHAKKIKFTNVSNLFTADITTTSIFDSSADSVVFPLPYKNAKSMTGEAGSDTTYSVMRTYDVTLDASGVGSVTLVAGESFSAINGYDYAISLTGAANIGTNFNPTTSLTLGGTPVGRTLNVNLGAPNASEVVRILTSVTKATTAPKVKTLRSHTMTIVFDNASRMPLAHADIYSVESVINQANNLDEVKLFGFFDGQRPNWYEKGELILKSGKNVNFTYEVTYTYFEHSMGDYFNVDSYGGMAREFIPTTKETASREEITLADCLDFRPLKDVEGDFTIATFNGDMVDPGDSVRFDLTYYLDRIDAIYLGQDGTYGAAKGNPSVEPKPIPAPSGSMKLFDLYVPAYTHDTNAISWTKIDNRRYTMRDIGKLEDRIRTLEYYTSLNMLESKISTTQVIDPVTGNNRFKNGFSADGFTDLKLSDFNDPQWDASIDPSVSVLKSPFIESGQDFVFGSGVNHARNELIMKSYTTKLMVDQPFASSYININPYAVFAWNGNIILDPVSDFWKDTVNLPPVIINQVFWNNATGGQPIPNAAGWNLVGPTVWSDGWSMISVTRREQNNWTTLISSTVIPFMRPIDIKFKLQNFKPFTRLYPFFNGVNISQFCNQNGKAKGEPLIVDRKGILEGIFSVPNTTTNRFATGEGVLRFTDMPNDERTVESQTSGQTTFASGGSTEVVQETRLTNTWVRQDIIARPVDPLAQTFFVPESSGCFLKKVDIFFATKAQSIPVIMEIRRVENGIPTNQIVSGGRLVKYPEDVSVSANASTATSFEFDDPLYLTGETEFAIVLMADTQEYNVWRAVMGENMIDRDMAIAKQPYIGVLLSSSNSSTWTPHQTEDLKFKVWRCVFDTVSDAVVTMVAKEPEIKMGTFNAFDTVTGSNVITMRIRNHGLRAGDKFTVANAIGGNDITANQLNAQHTVISSTIDQVTFSVSSAATATGTIGGESTTFKLNAPITEFVNYINQVILPGTSISWEYNYMVQNGRVTSGWIPFNQEDPITKLSREGVVTKAGDMTLRATLRSENPALSPVIDSIGMGLNLIGRRINQDLDAPAYSYVTRSVKFDNPSTSAKFWIGALLPGSNQVKLYVKLMTTGDENLGSKPWVEISPSKPVVNNSREFQEFEYQIEAPSGGSFIGYKARVVYLGNDPCNAPEMRDFRSVALA